MLQKSSFCDFTLDTQQCGWLLKDLLSSNFMWFTLLCDLKWFRKDFWFLHLQFMFLKDDSSIWYHFYMRRPRLQLSVPFPCYVNALKLTIGLFCQILPYYSRITQDKDIKTLTIGIQRHLECYQNKHTKNIIINFHQTSIKLA